MRIDDFNAAREAGLTPTRAARYTITATIEPGDHLNGPDA